MKTNKTMMMTMLCLLLGASSAGCSARQDDSTPARTAAPETTAAAGTPESTVTASAGGILDGSDLFSSRDLEQTADLTDAVTYTVQSGEDITIEEEGVYVLSGTAENMTVTVNAADDAKVQLVLDGLTVTNTDFPVIYVKNADKVFITTTDTDNTLAVTGEFRKDGSVKTDAVIFAKTDLVLNGTGTLTVNSSDNGIVSKDDLKVTGGTYHISCDDAAFEANDSICVSDGEIHILKAGDGLHAENDDDDSEGYIYIGGGTIEIIAADDAIHAQTVCQIDDGIVTISAPEAIEATYVQINGGTLDLQAGDDGINAGRKSAAYTPTIEITGGSLTIKMASGDTDAIDSNGSLIISGGTIDITAQSAFDFDGTVSFTGGTVTVNGQKVTSITNAMMGPGRKGH